MGGRSRRGIVLLIMVGFLTSRSTLAQAIPAQRILARVNGQDISEALFKVYAASKTGQPLARLSPVVRQALLEGLINTALLAQDGSRLKTSPTLQAGREMAIMSYLSTVYAAHFAQTRKLSNQQIQAGYQQLLATGAVQQYHLLQILMPDMTTGERVRAQLAQGLPFAKAVSDFSRDPVSRAKGGDLGWVSATTTVPNLAKPNELPEVLRIASELRTGGISEPFANSTGVHILMLVATEALPLADVKSRIQFMLLEKALIAHTAKLRAAAHITQLASP